MGDTVIEYGIQTANSKSILVITSDLADAHRTLDMIGDGRLVCRTVSYSRWQDVDTDAAAQNYSPVDDVAGFSASQIGGALSGS
jgi:hypothetical protein